MLHKKAILLAACFGFLFSTGCNSGEKGDKSTTSETTTETTAGTSDAGSNPKGIGPHQNVQLNHPLDQKMVDQGKGIYEVKCQSCHKLTAERLVGPGWKGVTDRRTPEWIMNFVTNVDVMIEKDTAAQRMLEECLVRMPNQNLSEPDARAVLEFMHQNDGKN